KGGAQTRVGICADAQDDKNYYLLTWSPDAAGSLDLYRVVDGERTLLARKAGGFMPGLWYEFGLRSAEGRLIAEVDHQPVLAARDVTFGEGKVGLYSEGKTGSVVYF